MEQKTSPIQPQPYDLSKPEEFQRLYKEVLGYMKTSLNANCPLKER